MRYYNENPQVTLWRDQAYKNQVLWRQCKQSLDIAKVRNSELFKELEALLKEVIKFNALPWYKKIFYKFKI